MKRTILMVAMSALLAASPAIAQQAPATGHDAALAKRLGADEHGMRKFVLVVLKTGPTRVPEGDARKAMFAGHFANMERLSKEGKLVLAGPFSNDPAGWRGLFVFAVDDIEEAKKLVATDPVIEKGEMVAEYHAWYSSAALMMIPELHTKLESKAP